MKNLTSSKFIIIIFLALLTGGIWFLSGYIKTTTEVGDPDKPGSGQSAPSEVVASSSALPASLVTRSTKEAMGVFRKVEGDLVFISNAHEDRSFKLGLAVNVILIVTQATTDPKAVPTSPVISTVAVEDLKEYDQLTLSLEKTTDEFVVTNIVASRVTN